MSYNKELNYKYLGYSILFFILAYYYLHITRKIRTYIWYSYAKER